MASAYINIHPNAGMPTGFGDFDNTPEEMAEIIAEFAQNGWVNIVGGCCGTNPERTFARSPPPSRGSSPGAAPRSRRG